MATYSIETMHGDEICCGISDAQKAQRAAQSHANRRNEPMFVQCDDPGSKPLEVKPDLVFVPRQIDKVECGHWRQRDDIGQKCVYQLQVKTETGAWCNEMNAVHCSSHQAALYRDMLIERMGTTPDEYRILAIRIRRLPHAEYEKGWRD